MSDDTPAPPMVETPWILAWTRFAFNRPARIQYKSRSSRAMASRIAGGVAARIPRACSSASSLSGATPSVPTISTCPAATSTGTTRPHPPIQADRLFPG